MRSIADLSFRNRRIIKEEISMGKEKGVKPVPGFEAYGQPELPSDIQAVSAGGRTDDDLRFLLQSDDKDPDPWDYDDYGDRDSDDDDDYLDDDDDFEDEDEDLLDIVERRSWSKPEMSRTLSERAEEEDEESEALVPVVSGVPALTQKTAAPVIATPPPVVPAAKASQSIAKPAKITAADSIRKKAVKTAKAVKTKPSTLKVAKVSARKVSKKVATKKAAVKKAAPKAPAKKAVKAPAKKAAKPAKKAVKKAVKKVAKKPVKKAAKKPVKKAAKK